MAILMTGDQINTVNELLNIFNSRHAQTYLPYMS